MKFSVEHIGLAATNPEALKDWCVATLDGELILAEGQNPPAFFVRLGGGLILEIYASRSRLSETSDNRLAGWRHLALRVDAIEPARDLLARRGVEFDQIKPAGGGGRVLFFKDPEGNLWHLVERNADSPLGTVWP